MSSMPWIKLHTRMLDDSRLGTLPDALKWRLLELNLLAGECDAEGYLVNGDEPLDMEAIAWRLRRNPSDLTADLEILAQRGFMAFEDETWLVVEFAETQGRPQHEKRTQWRERKRRQREREAQPDEKPDDAPQEAPPELDSDPSECHAGITRESPSCPAPREEDSRVEKIRESGRSPGSASSGGNSHPPPGLTEGQRYWLSAFGAKRFANNVQKAAVLALEREHGTDTLVKGVQWAAKQGMSMGRAVTALETALPKWGRPKGQAEMVTVKGLT